MINSLSVTSLQRQNRRAIAVSAGCAFGGAALAIVASAVLRNPLTGMGAIAAVLLLVALCAWVWQQPVRGAYVLFGAAVLLPTYDLPNLTDYIGRYLPFFPDIKSWSHVPIIVSAAELFMALALVLWICKGIAERSLSFDRGSLMLPLSLYMLMVLLSEIHGVATGGDFRDSLWEVRSQTYMLIAYVLICNLIRTRDHVMKLLWVLLVGTALRALEGTFQYLFILRTQNLFEHELYPHEQSYFFNGFLTLGLILALYRGPRRMKRFILCLLPFGLVAQLANNRRASIAAMCISFIALFLVTWAVCPHHRRKIAVGLLLFAAVYPPYYVHYQNRTGFLALPARAVSSEFNPLPADAASNQYRVNEDLDIIATVKASAIVGYGFGKLMLNPFPLPNINYVFQFLMPHNSILWIWMRLGTMGYLIFWFLIAAAISQTTGLAGRLRDPLLQGLAVFILTMLIQQVIISYVDLQWTNYRTMIATGVLFALISRLALLGASQADVLDSAAQPAAARKRRSGRLRVVPSLGDT